MRRLFKSPVFLIMAIVVLTGLASLTRIGKEGNPENGLIICTEIKNGLDFNETAMGPDRRYIPGARIIAFDPTDPANSRKVLSKDFYGARAPEISWDAGSLLFSGQLHEGDTWQIWKLDLQTLEYKQITRFPENCTDPAWIPDGRIIFSRLDKNISGGPIHTLYVCSADGSNPERIAFHPNSDISTSVARDGRLLVVSKPVFPEQGRERILAMRIDGTKSELFYRSSQNRIPAGKIRETEGGNVFFVEKDPEYSAGGRLVTVAYGHPLSSYAVAANLIEGFFHSVYPDGESGLIVSYRPDPESPFSLYPFDVRNDMLGDKIFPDENYSLIEPVLVVPRQLPMKLPLSVDTTVSRGTFLCHNARLSAPDTAKIAGNSREAERVEVYGTDGLVGEVPLQPDGSFYIEIDADTPVRFQTIDKDGDIVEGPSSWVWVRPKERRSCIGCHEDGELSPENRVPDALYNGMVSLPDGKSSGSIVLSGRN